ncbi:MAG: ATP-binding protein [candidate division KSB1 bacterium]
MENVVALQNPWKRGQPALQGEIITRRILSKIKSWLNADEILLIKGARQTGKTTIIYSLVEHLLASGVKPQNIFYFLLDNLKLQEEFSRHPYALKNTIETFLGQTLESYPERVYVFLDEVQKFSGFADVVKEYYDLLKRVKFILSGSSILQLSDRISESLRGRTMSFVVEPFSLTEVVPQAPAFSFADLHDAEQLRRHYAAAAPFQNEITLALQKQFVFGAMPRIYLSETNEQRQLRLEEYLQALIQRDLVETLRTAKYLDLEKLLRLLSLQTGQLLKISSLATQLQLTAATVKKYLALAEEAFVIDRLPPFFSNRRKGLIKEPKVYFRDMGMCNYLSRKAGMDLLHQTNLGHEAENFVHTILNQVSALAQTPSAQYFYRTTEQDEVDFVLQENTHAPLPIEVKYQARLTPSDYKPLLHFMQEESLDLGLVVSKNLFEQVQVEDKQVVTLPLWFFALLA